MVWKHPATGIITGQSFMKHFHQSNDSVLSGWSVIDNHASPRPVTSLNDVWAGARVNCGPSFSEWQNHATFCCTHAIALPPRTRLGFDIFYNVVHWNPNYILVSQQNLGGKKLKSPSSSPPFPHWLCSHSHFSLFHAPPSTSGLQEPPRRRRWTFSPEYPQHRIHSV